MSKVQPLNIISISLKEFRPNNGSVALHLHFHCTTSSPATVIHSHNAFVIQFQFNEMPYLGDDLHPFYKIQQQQEQHKSLSEPRSMARHCIEARIWNTYPYSNFRSVLCQIYIGWEFIKTPLHIQKHFVLSTFLSLILCTFLCFLFLLWLFYLLTRSKKKTPSEKSKKSATKNMAKWNHLK